MDRGRARALAEALVAKMSLEEKLSQLKFNAPAIERLGVKEYNWWNEALHGVARAGTATVFPQAICLAAIFDEEFLFKVADAIATEARAKYNAQSFLGDRGIYKGLTFWSPNINIFRDPRWGRGQETYGEDPYLTSRLGVSFVRGLQGDGKYMKAAACVKHFAAHSGPEATRHGFDAKVDEYDLRDTYLYAFEAAVKEGDVEAVMGAYNAVNGEPSCASERLIGDILRGEWGFEGHYVSDCGAICDINEHHKFTDTLPESAALALKAGCDLNCGSAYASLSTAYNEGLILEDDVTRAAVRLFTTRYLLGMFDANCEFNDINFQKNDSPANAALALDAARRSMVLLKNDGLLPLNPDKLNAVAVIGPNADSVRVLEGNYNGTSSRAKTFLEGIRAKLEGKARVNYSEGSHLYKDCLTGLSEYPDDRISEAVAMAKISDVCVMCLGLDSSIEGEEGDASNEYSSGDKTTLELPACQRRLLDAVLMTGKPVIIALSSGGAMRVDEGAAVVWTGYPGQAGGTALADILFGRVSPSGKLPVTFYRSVSDLPPFEDYSMAGRTYRYFKGQTLYPFGFGLSYTNFDYSLPEYDSEKREARINVKNNGTVEGEEVVEAYIRDMNYPSRGLNWKLCGFGRVALRAGEEKRVRIRLREDAFETFDEAGVAAVHGRDFRLWIGGSQPDETSVKLMGKAPVALNINV